MQILQILLQFIQRLPLGPIIWKLCEITEPHVAMLPVDISHRFHSLSIRLGHQTDNRQAEQHPASIVVPSDCRLAGHGSGITTLMSCDKPLFLDLSYGTKVLSLHEDVGD